MKDTIKLHKKSTTLRYKGR